MSHDFPRGAARRAPLSSRQLTALRTTRDRAGSLSVSLGLLAMLCFAASSRGRLAFGLLVASGSVGVALARQHHLERHAIPLADAAGSDRNEEFAALLCAAGRPARSVQVLVLADPQPNAYACWTPFHQRIVLTSGLLAFVGQNPAALRFCLAHELGHLRFHLPLGLLVRHPWALPGLLGPPGLLLRAVGFWWCREAEASADRFAVALTGEPLVALQVIVGLALGRLPSLDELPQLMARVQVDSAGTRGLDHLLDDHPPLAARLAALWSFIDP